ncbi:hypothetical protein SISNIDRAFT_468785 [Sistotremastrum niveocremeum HHB9708]|uniref:NYN domain-containing protein n=1 Tax=Sistotremastrum niveocremeum HHB9708 TaxID=1314777 RepID=A0A164R002_9AGAM|nr:hypothetical protein SISNIDRAFT_468785 [Sistotremastrum niveocremeum HHB9708]
MLRTSPDTASAASPAPPFSPFSSAFSIGSEGTSDEPADLGAFSSVFRALAQFQTQPPQVQQPLSPPQPSSPPLTLPNYRDGTDYESDGAQSTVWNSKAALSYLSSSSRDHDAPEHEHSSSEDPSSETGEDQDPAEVPTLGDLDSILGFLANERKKLTVTHREPKDITSQQSTAESPWKHVVSPRRKRRRKKKGIKAIDTGRATIVPSPEQSSSAELSSSPDRKHLTGASPGLLRMSLSRSTPNLLPVAPIEADDPQEIQLRTLAFKLKLEFPDNARSLSRLPLYNTDPNTGETFLDPRAPPALSSSEGPLTHVFIDHSNILIGLLSFLNRHVAYRPRNGKIRLSHAALALLLERGRIVSRRVLVASSPLYQPIDAAEQLGYSVRVFARVPDTGDGLDRIRKGRKAGAFSALSTDSDPGHSSPHTKRPLGGPTHSRTSSANAAITSSSHSTPPHHHNHHYHNNTTYYPGGRVRYREQGVDELLQLKLHQAIVDVDVPPPGSTIVLATGDGNTGQFNEEGFLGCVRTALKKGWHVDLYAWEEGLSRAWAREFGEDREWKDKFRIIGLEKYGGDLLEV